MPYVLEAERNGEVAATWQVASPEEAQAIVEQGEEDGTWPEGHDAVLTAPNGDRSMFVDDWEPL